MAASAIRSRIVRRALSSFLAAAWCGAACAPEPSAQSTTTHPASASTHVTIQVAPVALNPDDSSQRAVGRFVYAGGIEMRSAVTSVRFGGLSDLKVDGDGRMLSVTDEGQLVTARLVLDAGGRLTGIADVEMTPLTGLDGMPLRDKAVADSEGVATLTAGDRLVSFEREHRVWRYPAGGGAPVMAPTPSTAASFPLNSGMEALAAYPPAGAGAYLVGSEMGTVWLCAIDTSCRETPLGSRVPSGFGLTALAVAPDGETLALVGRSFSQQAGVRVAVRLFGRAAVDDGRAPMLDELELVAPLTRDNVEGLALTRGASGALRLYLLTDNNFSATQHTYLLAFDWRPNP